MRHQTARALALISQPPYSVGTTDTDYLQAPDPRETRAIRDKNQRDVFYEVATAPLGDGSHESRRANALAELWARSPEVLAALSALVQVVELSGTPETKVLEYAKATLHRTERDMLAAFNL